MNNMTPEEILVEIDKLREKENLVKDEKVKPLSEYEISRLPKIPNDWNWVLINDISTFITNGVHTPTGPEDINGYGLHCLRITDIQGDSDIDYNQLPYCLRIVSGDYDKKLRKGDIYFSFTGNNLGKRFIVKEDREDTVYAHYFVRWHPLIVNPYYVYYAAHSKVYDQFIQERTLGSTQPNLKVTDLKRFPIPLSDLEKQNKIANFLKNIDDKISCNKAINRNLEDQSFALFDSYFTNVMYGEKKIGDYITPSRGKNLVMKDAVPGDIPVVAGGLSPSTYHNEANTVGPVLTISASGANAGYVGLWNQSIWSSDSSYIDSKMTDNVYFWYVMLKKRQKEIFDSQTGSAQPHIYPKNIEVMPVIDLDKGTIEDYSKEVTPMFCMIGNNNKENIRLAALRDSLLPKLMSGELDVSELEI